jgi:hypothetical protein
MVRTMHIERGMSPYHWPVCLLGCFPLLACETSDGPAAGSTVGTEGVTSVGASDGGHTDASIETGGHTEASIEAGGHVDSGSEADGQVDATSEADGQVDATSEADGQVDATSEAGGGDGAAPSCPGADAAPTAPCESCCCAFTVAYCTVPTPLVCGGSSDDSEYGFESGTQGWMLADASNTTIPGQTSVVHPQAFAGEGSLAVAMSIPAGSEDYVRLQFPGAGPGPGDTVTFHVWAPASGGLLAIQPYAMDAASTWNGSYVDAGEIVLGCWATVTVPLPATFVGPLSEIGVEFFAASGGPYEGTAYVDSVSW